MLVARAAAGDSFVWIGPPQKIPSEFWIGHYRPSEAAMKVVAVPRGPLVHESLPPNRSERVGSLHSSANENAEAQHR